MEAFTSVAGPAIPLLLPNIDTDVIIRIERLAVPDRSQIGRYAFEALRTRKDGSPNPDTPLNDPRFAGAPILLAGPNFGCGSSREGAVWALAQMGIRCVVGSSFGDIFFSNCFQNGVLAVRLPEAEVARLAAEAGEGDFIVDLEQLRITAPSGEQLPFTVEKQRRDALLAGLDDIGMTLADSDAITRWQSADRRRRPWVWMHAA